MCCFNPQNCGHVSQRPRETDTLLLDPMALCVPAHGLWIHIARWMRAGICSREDRLWHNVSEHLCARKGGAGVGGSFSAMSSQLLASILHSLGALSPLPAASELKQEGL